MLPLMGSLASLEPLSFLGSTLHNIELPLIRYCFYVLFFGVTQYTLIDVILNNEMSIIMLMYTDNIGILIAHL